MMLHAPLSTTSELLTAENRSAPGSPPLVSVVLPVFNRAASVDAAIRSVLEQTVVDLELIVVDDASEQPVRPSSDSATDVRLRVLRREVNGGVAAAQNSGLHDAHGEFVGFIHSDDQWMPDKLERQVPLLASTAPPAAAVESATQRLHRGGARVVPARLAGCSYEDLLCRRVKNLHVTGFLFRREALLEVGGFDDGLRAYEDLDLLIRLRRAHDVVSSDDVVAVVDQAGSDRLGDSVWMQRGREHLLAKYERELMAVGGVELPAGWRDWSVQAALAALNAGEGPAAREHVRRSVGHRRSRWIRRWPLWAASYGGERTGHAVASIYAGVQRRSTSPSVQP